MRTLVAAAAVLALATASAQAQESNQAPAEPSKPTIAQTEPSNGTGSAIKTKPGAAEDTQAPQASLQPTSPEQPSTSGETAGAASSKEGEAEPERSS